MNRFQYTDPRQAERGGFPLNNFKYLKWGKAKTKRMTVRKSPFVFSDAKENYISRTYTKIAENFKITSNRTADMFNARGFDIKHNTVRIL